MVKAQKPQARGRSHGLHMDPTVQHHSGCALQARVLQHKAWACCAGRHSLAGVKVHSGCQGGQQARMAGHTAAPPSHALISREDQVVALIPSFPYMPEDCRWRPCPPPRSSGGSYHVSLALPGAVDACGSGVA